MNSGRDGEREAGGAWPGLDLVKFWCVFWMILLHTYFWVATEYGYINTTAGEGRGLGWMKYLMVFGFFPLMLPVTAGCSFRFSLGREGKLARLEWPDLIKVFLSAIFVCIAGFAMNGLSVGLRGLIAWNVLQLVALSFVVIGLLLMFLPVWSLAPIAAAMVLATPSIRAPFNDSDSYWALAIFGRAPSSFGWPFFPWFASVAFGVIVTDFWMRRRDDFSFKKWLALAGTVLTIAPLLDGNFLPTFDSNNLMGGHLFNPPPTFLFGVLGISAFMIVVGMDVARFFRWKRYGIVDSYSRGILWIYVVHLVVGTRLYEWLSMRFRIPLVDAGPVIGPVIAAGFTLFLLGISWLTGFAVIRMFGEKVVRVRLRRVRA